MNSEFLSAHLELNGNRIDIEYQATVTRPHGAWAGEFFVEAAIEPGEYHLLADDGRRGAILVQRVFPNESGSCRCEFEGVGEFA